MTHKNPELRAGGVVKVTENAAPAPAVKHAAAPAAKPPKLELSGNKWVVENHTNNNNLVIENPELKHTVYIYGCTNSTIQIKGKVNAVTIDGSKKVGVLVESVVATVDIVNCKSAQVQITGKAPTVVVDKTDGLQLFLSKDCLDVEILSAKSSEMNVSFQDSTAGPQSDFVERPVPEQFKTIIREGQLVTVPVEHKG
ncbi:hypothetical protein HK102_009836 [Quaeritorhiza haematococci]|nr:hypothetical protein HK102_009836 [Quaeritorhiza haematococci]